MGIISILKSPIFLVFFIFLLVFANFLNKNIVDILQNSLFAFILSAIYTYIVQNFIKYIFHINKPIKKIFLSIILFLLVVVLLLGSLYLINFFIYKGR